MAPKRVITAHDIAILLSMANVAVAAGPMASQHKYSVLHLPAWKNTPIPLHHQPGACFIVKAFLGVKRLRERSYTGATLVLVISEYWCCCYLLGMCITPSGLAWKQGNVVVCKQNSVSWAKQARHFSYILHTLTRDLCIDGMSLVMLQTWRGRGRRAVLCANLVFLTLEGREGGIPYCVLILITSYDLSFQGIPHHGWRRKQEPRLSRVQEGSAWLWSQHWGVSKCWWLIN